MRVIDADEFKDRLIRALRIDTVNENAPIGNDKRHTMKIEYKFSFYEIVKLLNQSPTITSSCDADSILGVYDKGYSEGREDALSEAKSMKDYCENDCDAIHEAYSRGYSKGFSDGREDVLIAEECKKRYCDINRKMEEQAKKQMKDYCKNDCDTLSEAYDNGYSKGFSDGREEEKKEVMLLTDHCIGKCNILDSVLHMEGEKDD